MRTKSVAQKLTGMYGQVSDHRPSTDAAATAAVTVADDTGTDVVDGGPLRDPLPVVLDSSKLKSREKKQLKSLISVDKPSTPRAERKQV